ncbi:MAG: undecaprenyldiphospho-muramoylpentapeptide beta-N-acetylglucosaminyltransferase [Steroidobacteraceae bacterium]
MSGAKVLIMAGGTGGHVFPALALARSLRAAGVSVAWLGTARGMEARVVPAEKIPLATISVVGLRGKGFATLALAPLRLVRALWQAIAVIRRVDPVLVVGLGGFASGPGGVAARLLRRPLFIHEQNAIAGFTNRVLAHLASRVFEAFAGSFATARRAETIGNPLREEFFRQDPPSRRRQRDPGSLRLLVVGGSQGAARLNAIVPLAVAQLQHKTHLSVRHQTGDRWIEQARNSYAKAGVEAELLPFIGDMAESYAWADLVICRAGALTISEIAAVGVAAILVPFPQATDDHQSHNARTLVRCGAAVLISDRELNPERLAREIDRLAADRPGLARMAEQAGTLACPEATQRLRDACLGAIAAAGAGA